jgi:hypothetical protein
MSTCLQLPGRWLEGCLGFGEHSSWALDFGRQGFRIILMSSSS